MNVSALLVEDGAAVLADWLVEVADTDDEDSEIEIETILLVDTTELELLEDVGSTELDLEELLGLT